MFVRIPYSEASGWAPHHTHDWRPTHDAGNALFTRDRFSMIAFPTLKRLCQVYGVLFGRAKLVQLDDTALGYHFPRREQCFLAQKENNPLGLTLPLRVFASSLTKSSLSAMELEHISESTYNVVISCQLRGKKRRHTKNLVWLPEAKRQLIQ